MANISPSWGLIESSMSLENRHEQIASYKNWLPSISAHNILDVLEEPESQERHVWVPPKQLNRLKIELQSSKRVCNELSQRLEFWKEKCGKLENNLQGYLSELVCHASAAKSSSKQEAPHLTPRKQKTRGEGKSSVWHEIESSACPIAIRVYIMRLVEELSHYWQE